MNFVREVHFKKLQISNLTPKLYTIYNKPQYFFRNYFPFTMQKLPYVFFK